MIVLNGVIVIHGLEIFCESLCNLFEIGSGEGMKNNIFTDNIRIY